MHRQIDFKMIYLKWSPKWKKLMHFCRILELRRRRRRGGQDQRQGGGEGR